MPGTPVSIHRVEQDIEQWLEHERSAGRPSGLVLETLDGDPIGLAIILVDGYSGASATVSLAIDPGWQDQGYGRDLSRRVRGLHDEDIVATHVLVDANRDLSVGKPAEIHPAELDPQVAGDLLGEHTIGGAGQQLEAVTRYC